MKAPVLRASFDLSSDELIVDNFAGGGGASTGIEAALGRPVDIAINHSPVAIAMHKRNHPETRHYIENILDVDPVEVASGRPVGLAWFSPDCTHFSRAKGNAPLKKEIRGLAWVVVRWAQTVRPRVIVVENVEEFMTWGPLGPDERPDRSRMGETFAAWLAELRALGYVVEYRTLVAADYGAPTTRKRFFLIARCDGRPIVWPEATHGAGRQAAWRAAAEVIDWSVPTPTIFDRSRPLADATLARIARGLERYVFSNASPFIIPCTHHGDRRVHGIDEPIRTITGAHRGELALVQPFIVRHGHYSKRTGAGLRPGCGAGTFRGQPLQAPLATVCATNDKHLVVPYLSKFYGTSTGSAVSAPVPTVTSGGGKGGGHAGLIAAFLVKYYRTGGGCAVDEPLPTVTGKARFAAVSALLRKHGGHDGGRILINGDEYALADIGMRMLQPHELFLAQGFPRDYEIHEVEGRRLTKTQQIQLAGNSVCPPVAEALVRSARRAA